MVCAPTSRLLCRHVVTDTAPHPPPSATPTPAPVTTPVAVPAWLAVTAEERARLAAVLQGGVRTWRFGFSPAPALADRGIIVDSIRAHLREAGELITAAPCLTDEGKGEYGKTLRATLYHRGPGHPTGPGDLQESGGSQ